MSNVRVVCGFCGSAARAAWFDALVFLIRCESLLQAHSASAPSLSLFLSLSALINLLRQPPQPQQFIYYAAASSQFAISSWKFMHVSAMAIKTFSLVWAALVAHEMGITLANLSRKERNLKSVDGSDNWQAARSVYVCVCLLPYCSYKCWCTKRDLHDELPNAHKYIMHSRTWVEGTQRVLFEHEKLL